jgi:hypothetical protein
MVTKAGLNNYRRINDSVDLGDVLGQVKIISVDAMRRRI